MKEFSHEFRQPRGLYIAYPDKDRIDEILDNRSNPEIDVIVVSDGEGVLGIGDQGVGGMDIPVAKLMVYSLCGGIDPCRTLPIFLDVGTNNQALLDDPMYLGLRNKRISGAAYDEFIEAFVAAVTAKFPRAFLHWEDFGPRNARHILNRYKDNCCTFNDDIQGTGAVTLAALLAAGNITQTELTKQKIIVYGAGSAGTGISDQIVAALCQQGLTKEQAYQCFWLIDRQGLLIQGDPDLTHGQLPYARARDEIKGWHFTNANTISLLDTITNVHPTILIGTSSQPGAFSREIVLQMSEFCERPIILPLSNPTEKCEAHPRDLIEWTKGRALIATGTRFDPITYQQRVIPVAQCNNALVFPGIGLGILAVAASRLTAGMLWEACNALSLHSPAKHDFFAPLLPPLDKAKEVALSIAIAVAQQACREGLAQTNQTADFNTLIPDLFWEPRYLPFRRKK